MIFRDEQITVAWLSGNGISHGVRHKLNQLSSKKSQVRFPARRQIFSSYSQTI